MKGIPEWRQFPTLICNLDPSIQIWTVSILEDVVACMNDAGETAAVFDLFDNVAIENLSPLLHYYLGNAYRSIGDIPSARTEYELSLESSENPYFRNALENLLDK